MSGPAAVSGDCTSVYRGLRCAYEPDHPGNCRYVIRPAPDTPPAPPRATVWMTLREGDEHQWLPVSLHEKREAAVAALPAGSVHHPEGPDVDWDPLDREHWTAPSGNPWYGTDLVIREWEVEA